jgi:hypothetical protein
MVKNRLSVCFSFDFSGFFKESEMGEGFSRREERLHNRERVPGVTIDIPGHL